MKIEVTQTTEANGCRPERRVACEVPDYPQAYIVEGPQIPFLGESFAEPSPGVVTPSDTLWPLARFINVLVDGEKEVTL